jgi:hypothetical protein
MYPTTIDVTNNVALNWRPTGRGPRWLLIKKDRNNVKRSHCRRQGNLSRKYSVRIHLWKYIVQKKNKKTAKTGVRVCQNLVVEAYSSSCSHQEKVYYRLPIIIEETNLESRCHLLEQ